MNLCLKLLQNLKAYFYKIKLYSFSIAKVVAVARLINKPSSCFKVLNIFFNHSTLRNYCFRISVQGIARDNGSEVSYRETGAEI